MTKLNKPTTNATVTPTVNKNSVAKCGIPAPAPNGRNNLKLSLADDVVAKLSALEKPLPAQAQAILYTLDQLGGTATQGALIKELDEQEETILSNESELLNLNRKLSSLPQIIY